MRILFLTPYPKGAAPSQRFRFEQYYDDLKELGYSFECHGFWSDSAWQKLYNQGLWFNKILWLMAGFFNRLILILTKAKKFDHVFIHREADPLCTGIFPFILSRIFKKKIIYDFDDAIWIPNSSESNRFFMRFKNWNNTAYISRLAYKVSAGNEYLCNYARQFNKNVIYNPTTIQTENQHNKVKVHDKTDFVIGWTGTHSTINYLNDLEPVFIELNQKIKYNLVIICDSKPELTLPNVTWVPWNKNSEIEDLLLLNVGLMPLRQDKWSEGKCGFKALQYMALGIPALVSPVGVNSIIVDHGVNGFICETENDWVKYIVELYENRDKLVELGRNTREKIVKNYSHLSNRDNFVKLFT